MGLYFIEADTNLGYIGRKPSPEVMWPDADNGEGIQWWQSELKALGDFRILSTITPAISINEKKPELSKYERIGRNIKDSNGRGIWYTATIGRQYKDMFYGRLSTDTLVKGLKFIGSEKSRPFSVVSSNYAHHFSYGLSVSALSTHGSPNNTKVLLNFDRHKDYGVRGGTTVTCGNWGAKHLDQWASHAPGAVYIILGELNNQNIYASTIPHTNLTDQSTTKTTLDDDNIKVLIKKNLENTKCDIYITVDLDVYKETNTHYSFKESDVGRLSSADVRKSVVDTLALFKQKQCVGIDITGLPTHKATDEHIKQAVKEITYYYGLLSRI